MYMKVDVCGLTKVVHSAFLRKHMMNDFYNSSVSLTSKERLLQLYRYW